MVHPYILGMTRIGRDVAACRDAPRCIRFGDVGRRHGAGEGGGALAQEAPLGASLVGSPRQERALAAAAAGPRVPFPIAQRQPSPFVGLGDAVWSSADAERFSYERIKPRAAAATHALARGHPSGAPLTRLWALRALPVAGNSFVGGCATRCVARLR